MWRRWLAIVSAVGIVCAVLATTISALAVPTAPPLDVPIVDQTSTLSSSDIQQLATQIATSRAQKSYQIGILIIPTLGSDEYLEGYSLKVARQWGIGEKDKDNGVLILVAKNDRKMRIEVGRGLEGDLTDARANRIIREVLSPAFRKGDFAGGLSAAVDSIQKAVSMQADPKLVSSGSAGGMSGIADALPTVLFFSLFGLSWVGSMLARSKSWWAGGIVGGVVGVVVALFGGWVWWTVGLTALLVLVGLLLDFLVSKNYHQHRKEGSLPSWWAGGGSLGGGGWSGGGGFSGGGSSGSW